MGRPVMIVADARDWAVSTLMSRLVCSRSRSVSEMLSSTSARFPPTRLWGRIEVGAVDAQQQRAQRVLNRRAERYLRGHALELCGHRRLRLGGDRLERAVDR